MAQIPGVPPPANKNLFPVIFLTGIITGVLDIAAAIIKFYIETGRGPEPIFRYIASGVYGYKAFTGGNEIMIWGIIFHFIIAFIFSAVLLLLFPSLYRIIRSTIIIGILYGLFVWLIMNQVILSLSNIPPRPPFEISQALVNMGILIIAVGIPIALIAKQRFRR
jgi:hypothetical protein